MAHLSIFPHLSTISTISTWQKFSSYEPLEIPKIHRDSCGDDPQQIVQGVKIGQNRQLKKNTLLRVIPTMTFQNSLLIECQKICQ